MYWYLQRAKERPFAEVQKVGGAVADGTFDKLPDEEKIKITERLKAYDMAAGRNYYQPNSKEYTFLLKPHFIKGISGGNRSGKTATCVIDIVSQCEGWHPLQRGNLEKIAKESFNPKVREIANNLLKERKYIPSPPIHARCVTVDYTNYVEKILGQEYVKWATKADLKSIDYDNDKKRKISWKNGSYVEFMTLEQDLSAHGGAARHVVHFDEEPYKQYWIENMMRVISLKGRMLLGMTAVNGVTWTEDEVWVKGERGDPDVYTIEMTSYDNPINTPEMIDKIKKSCEDETEVAIRIYGKRRPRGGKVYKRWRAMPPYVVPKFKLPEDGYLLLLIDPHPKTPHALLWVWVDYEGSGIYPIYDNKPNLYKCAESFRGGTIPEMVDIIESIEESLGRKHDFCIVDRAAWSTDQKDEGKSIATQLEEHELVLHKGSKDLSGGILKVKELLTPVTIDGKTFPRYMTMEHLERTIWEYQQYRWRDPPRNRNAVNTADPQKPVDKDDHMMENARRAAEFIWDMDYDVYEIKEEKPKFRAHGKVVDLSFPDEDEDDENIGIVSAILGE